MSELVALCFDADASPGVRFVPRSGDVATPTGMSPAIFGWGVGWYPSSERGASVVKDPTSSGERNVSDALVDWKRFQSTIFVCHLRGHRRPRNQEDAQPFVRSYGGRQWIFAHDGDLDPGWVTRFPLQNDPAFEPLGRTDSEHALCWLLARMHAIRARSLVDVGPSELHAWMSDLDSGGQLNALLTDGEHIAAYRDGQGRGSFHWTRRVPPHATTDLSSDAVKIVLDAPEDPNRTVLVFSSLPLTNEPWRELAPGELILARRGSVVWSSAPAGSMAPSPQARQQRGTPAAHIEAGHQSAAAQPRSQWQPIVADLGNAQTATGSRSFTVVHDTHYEYEQPVERSSHRVLLRPVEDRHQELLDFSFDIALESAASEYEDVFGNAAYNVEISGPYTSLRIAARATVRLRPAPALEQRAAVHRHSIPLVWMPWQRQMLASYLLPPELPETQLRELSDFAMSFVERNDSDLVGTLLDINETIYRDFEYVSGSTTNETTAFEVFQSRRGVCQDFANLMICIARLLQVPARYRMGYIHTGAHYQNKIQSEASHAWVEVYVPQVGWHGFDPTNGIQAGTNHIRVACGRNYRDATPTSGTIYRGGGTETLAIAVRVEEVPG